MIIVRENSEVVIICPDPMTVILCSNAIFWMSLFIPSGKLLHNYGKSHFLRGKSTINGPFSIAMLVYNVSLPEGTRIKNLAKGKEYSEDIFVLL